MSEEQMKDSHVASPEYVKRQIEADGAIPLVLFSGGLDSTHALLDTLRSSHVDVLYIAGAQGVHKINAELQAVEDILSQITNITRDYGIRNVYKFRMETDSFKDGNIHCGVTGKNFSQPPQWLQGMMAVARSDRHSRIVLSYITGDQMLSHLQDLTYAWNYINAFVFGKYEAIPLSFPLRYSKKRDLINAMPIGILAKIWTCELPEWDNGDRTALEPGIDHTNIASLAEMKPDRSYKYLQCGTCPACLTQQESYHTSMYKTHEGMLNVSKMDLDGPDNRKMDPSIEAAIKTAAPLGEPNEQVAAS